MQFAEYFGAAKLGGAMQWWMLTVTGFHCMLAA
jgi:hypothetical protein